MSSHGSKLELARVVMALRRIWWTAAVLAFVAGAVVCGQEAPQQPTFRSGVDLVTVRAVVRDGRGRPVTHLQRQDFTLIDRGVARPIASFDQDPGPVGLALLFDVSGSMDVATKLERAREASYFLLSKLRSGTDEAAIYAFDSRLHLVQPFTTNIDGLRGRLSDVEPWGVTSLHDAIAAAAESVGTQEARRRALVVLTDGIDTSSRLSAPEVSRIASAIDVPVYVMAIVSPIDLQDAEGRRDIRSDATRQGSLADLARWTGGQLLASTSSAQSSQAAQRIIDELRTQYLLAFEPGPQSGWHPLEVRVRNKDYVVQARSGYVAGQFRPSS